MRYFGQDQLAQCFSIFGRAFCVGTTVMNAVVNPTNQHVFAWSQAGDVQEWDKDGNFIREWTPGNEPGQFPGLSTVRGLAFDQQGRMYLTVAEGTDGARVMILAQTPPAITETCAVRSTDKTSVDLQ